MSCVSNASPFSRRQRPLPSMLLFGQTSATSDRSSSHSFGARKCKQPATTFGPETKQQVFRTRIMPAEDWTNILQCLKAPLITNCAKTCPRIGAIVANNRELLPWMEVDNISIECVSSASGDRCSVTCNHRSLALDETFKAPVGGVGQYIAAPYELAER